MPSAISVNMLSCRVRSERQPRSKNGLPPQSTTGVASSSWIHASAAAGTACATRGGHEHLRHREREQRQREQAAQPEAAAHVEQLGARLVGERRRHRLERHPADRTRAGGVAHDLGVHRTGETRRCRRRRRGRPGERSQPTLGLRDEALAAAIAAEAVADAGVLEPTRALPGDAHAAHGIARGRRGRARRAAGGLQSPRRASSSAFTRARRRVSPCMTAQGTGSGPAGTAAATLSATRERPPR